MNTSVKHVYDAATKGSHEQKQFIQVNYVRLTSMGRCGVVDKSTCRRRQGRLDMSALKNINFCFMCIICLSGSKVWAGGMFSKIIRQTINKSVRLSGRLSYFPHVILYSTATSESLTDLKTELCSVVIHTDA